MNYYEFNARGTSWPVVEFDMGASAELESLSPAVDRLVAELDAARAARDYARADEVRAMLRCIRVGTVVRYGVSVCTGKAGTEWHWTITE
jgi:cysteinyl-tRNA synthetase